MDLIRLDSTPNPNPNEFPDDHVQTEYGVEQIDEYADPESARLRVEFKRFGRGEQRRSSFAVEMNWLDVKRFLSEFMELGHPEALHLRRMIGIVQAIERMGWEPADPPPEFWNDFPPAEPST